MKISNCIKVCVLFSYLMIVNNAVGVQLAKVFSDHMVIQQQKKIPVWGTSSPFSEILVAFNGEQQRTFANSAGQWRVEFSPMVASFEPQELNVTSENNVISITDILIGEVWLASGQSNMRFTVAQSLNGQTDLAKSTNKNIRLLDFIGDKFKPVERSFSLGELSLLSPENYFHSLGWQVSNDKSTQSFSAVAFYFAKRLEKQLQVPVGIINVSVGGALMESFISPDVLQNDPVLAPLVGENWLENIPQWCADRVKLNISNWLEQRAHEALPQHPYKPGFLFQAGIKTLIPYAIRGVIWYQGESNAPIDEGANPYVGALDLQLSKRKFNLLIDNWRNIWNNNELPFLFVQLPGLNRPWAPYRQMQTEVFNHDKHTGMIISYDVGESNNVHPVNKKPVGERLALWALANTYHYDLVFSGPNVKSTVSEGNSLHLKFDQSIPKKDIDIASDNNMVNGFEIAAKDGEFYPAMALIKDGDIWLSHPKVIVPSKVRYAWFDDPKRNASLKNEQGMPAAPFWINL